MHLDQAGLEVLTPTECLQLLAGVNRGRVAINVGALPVILPVRFVLNVDRIVFTAAAGTTLARATDDTVVAFQADGTEPDDEWSVSLIGIAHHLTDPCDVARAAVLPLPRWSKDLPPVFVAIPAQHVSGQRASGSIAPR